MKCVAAVALLGGVVLFALPLRGRAHGDGEIKLLTPEASLNLRAISDLQYSPDGKRLAFVVMEPAKGQGRKRHIWIHESGEGGSRQFTYSEKSESGPRWSPDGKTLAFLSDRGEAQQIYLMRADGGEGVALTKGKNAVRGFEWSPDGKQIAYTAPDAKSEAEEKKEKDKDDAHVVDKTDKRARVWLVDVATGETKALTKPSWEVRELAWMRNGTQLVIEASDHPESDQFTEKIYGVQAVSGETKLLLAPRGPFGELKLSTMGNTISFVGSREDGPEPHDLMLLPVNGFAAHNLTGASLDRPVEAYQWEKDGTVLMVAANGFKSKLVKFKIDASKEDLEVSPVPTGAIAISNGGEIAYVSQTGTTAPEVWIWNSSGGAPAKQVSQVNDAWKQFRLATPEYYKYKSFDGTEIEAALLRPVGGPNASAPTKLPLIALIHGGPTGRWSDAIETWGQLLAARGYAVFYPNIRGSVGYGQKFVETNKADWGGGDYKDVMAGVKDLVDRGIADPNRLGIGGWSYGGYMAEWAITQTSEFKVAVSGAGMANLISEFGMEDHPAGDEWFFGTPWESPEKFLNSSPFIHFKDVKTPTLVLQGDADTIDPLGQSQELYRGLKRYGVETELVVYPREPHGFHEEKHLVDRLNRILGWFDKYLMPGAGDGKQKTGD
ncbi:MAG TPA: S9 family peptidase [Candidatus Sulfotelmatobacter sp.]|nr:S9 family peptidase [Candidatus Sulfotelmatobacter sp.]